VTTIDWFRHR